jgi:ornithine--oxo-acid transaminase
MNSLNPIEKAEKYGAQNYHPLPITIAKAEGVWVWDDQGEKFLDMLSGYSAVSHGHLHPKVVAAAKAQLDRVTLISRAFYAENFGTFAEKLCALTKKDKILPMNTGAEAVETAIKAARKWGYVKKGIAKDQAEIITCANNFHGRTTTVVGFSTEFQYYDGFGPYSSGFKTIPYGNIQALGEAIHKNTAAFLVEPIQGEAGIIIPPDGYLRKARQICEQNNVLFIADEIQTGLGRTGRIFACDHESVDPDIYIIGKALGGGIMPVSAIAANTDVMEVFKPGDHGSTFGGNPLACAVGIAAIDTLLSENLAARSAELGDYFLNRLMEIGSDLIEEIRGKGLFIGIELKESAGGARRFCEQLKKEGMLCKETHQNVIRFAPPLVIEKSELDWAFERVKRVLSKVI